MEKDCCKYDESEMITFFSQQIDQQYRFGKENGFRLEHRICDCPAEMFDQLDDEGKMLWKPIPSTLSDTQIRAFEEKTEFAFPPSYRAYLKSRFHYFGINGGWNDFEIEDEYNGPASGTAGITPLPSNEPFKFLEPFSFGSDSTIKSHHRLLKFGFFCFAQTLYDYGMYFDINSTNEKGEYAVYAMHESFHLDTFFELEFDTFDVSAHIFKLADSFLEYFETFLKPDSCFKTDREIIREIISQHPGKSLNEIFEFANQETFRFTMNQIETVYYCEFKRD